MNHASSSSRAVLELRALGLRPGDAHRERVPVSFAPLHLGGQRYEARPDQVEVEVEVQATSGGTYLTLRFAASVCGPCYRCLEEACAPVRVRASAYHDAGAEVDADELSSDYLEDGLLDVGGWAREALVLALPDKLLCSPDCAGLCARCGERLEAGVAHDCGQHDPDPRWAKLQDLL